MGGQLSVSAIGGQGMPLQEFLTTGVNDWF